MDIVELLFMLLLAAALACALHNFRKPSVLGTFGEAQVSAILRSLPKQYYVINDIIIPGRRGTTQIDHVVVSPYGIFVIETKNYSGWVFGSEKSKTWKETFKTTGAKHFYNPVKQNWGHVYALSEYLNLDRSLCIPIVVFSDKATLFLQTASPVIYMSQLKRFLLGFQQEILPAESVETIYHQLQSSNLLGTDLGDLHTQMVLDSLSRQKASVLSGVCPRCGGQLVLRNGKYGPFYGCSRYPKCTFTHNCSRN